MTASPPTPPGDSAPHPKVHHAQAVGWIQALASNPTQALALAGVLLLGGMQGADAIRGRDLEADLQAELTRREIADAQKAQIAQAATSAAACVSAVADLRADLVKADKSADVRSDEHIAFLGEIVQYLERLASKLTSDAPAFGPRLDEYVRKALMRGYRDPGNR